MSTKLLAVARKGVPGVPGLKVKAAPMDDIYGKLLTGLAARAYVPDITALNSDVASFFPHEDQFLDLNSLGAGALKGQYLDWKWQGGIAPSGRMIGFPIDGGPSALYYRKDIFHKAGIPSDPDELAQAASSWEDYFAVGKKLRSAVPGSFLVGNIASVFRMSLLQSPKQFVDQDNHFIGDQEHVKRCWDLAVESLRQKLSAKINDGTPDSNAAYAQGRIASACNAVWWMGGIKQIASKTSGAWRVTKMPGGAANYGGSFLAIPKYCRDPEDAFAFVKWLLGPANQLAAYQEMALFPTTPAVYDKPAMRKPDKFFGGQRPVDVFGPAAEQAPVVYFSPYEGTASTPVYQELTNVELLGKNPDKAWRDAMAAAEKTLSQKGVS
ncbi:ABC transporter substrate-binding protein [Streptomyces spongiae]|uniref:ABC transporter substrate-binding protein n=1 Tax=Streptomyces spongiae TaxID=565072 RepID=UPI001D1420D8|nr:extracellular solute-binding protein [Streptomyces spongiae]